MKTLAERLTEARTEANLTQGQLAQRAGCGQSTVASIERGRNQSSTFLMRLAEILDVSPIWLAEGRGPKRSTSRSAEGGRSALNATEPLQTHYAFQWPFKLINIERIRALSEREIGYVEGRLIAAVEECERTGAANTPQAGKSA